MEPQIHQPEVDKHPVNKITPLSKYLAMALFVLMPFIGGYIGYTLSSETVVETERIIEVEKTSPQLESSTAENLAPPLSVNEEIATRVIIDTLPLNSGMQGSFPNMKKYTFQNGFYTVSFDLSRYATFRDDYTDPSIDDLGKGTYLGIF
jgi:hypothetical protein